jgi:hypothetical protein
MPNPLYLRGLGAFFLAIGTSCAQQASAQPASSFGVSCAEIESLGLEKQMNLRAAAIRAACGLEKSPPPTVPQASTNVESAADVFSVNVDVITGQTALNVLQGASAVWSSNGKRIVITYNDATDLSPINLAGISYSTDAGATFKRIRPSPLTGHGAVSGNPHVIYNQKLAKWFIVALATGCGAGGLGTWASTDGVAWTATPCAHTGSSDDTPSMWVDNNPGSPFYGRMYVSWNDFALAGQVIRATRSDDGITWSSPISVTGTFIRNVQVIVGPDGTVFIFGMNEGGGGLTGLRTNLLYRSTNGGVSFSTAISMGAATAAAGDAICVGNSYLAIVNPNWRYFGWGRPGVGPGGIVHYAFGGRGTAPDTGDIFYIRSADNGLTWSVPVRLNQDATTRTQWLPSLSVTASGAVQVYWYDRRNSTDGQNYEIIGRRSLDQGATFLPEETISNVLIPMPAHDPNLQSCYVSDYEISTAFGRRHYATWVDGRVKIDPAAAFQADVFFAARSAGVGAAHDFSAVNRSGIAWRDNAGNVAIWLMNGATVSSSGGVGTVPAAWQLVGQRDFNGDGKADLLWRDTSGNTAMWFMNGTSVTSTASVGNIPSAWSIVGTGDASGEGRGDLLWRDTSGNVAVWAMNGATIVGSAALGNVPTTWIVAGHADFNGDGTADILWRDGSGNVALWFMNDVSVASSATVGNVPPAWSIVATGDFNGDGKADLVWRDTAGNTAVWLMNGANVVGTAGLGIVAGGWTISQTGDFNGDGKADLLWRNTSTGDVAIWFMNGTSVASSSYVANVPTTWTIQSANVN